MKIYTFVWRAVDWSVLTIRHILLYFRQGNQEHDASFEAEGFRFVTTTVAPARAALAKALGAEGSAVTDEVDDRGRRQP